MFGFLYNESVDRVSCKSLSCLISIVILLNGDKQETFKKLNVASVQNIIFFKLFSQLSCIPFLRQ